MLWRWLSESKNQKTLAWLGGGVIIVVGGVWQAYVHFSDSPAEDKPPISNVSASNGGIASGGAVTIGGNAIVQTGSGTITIGYTLAQIETELKQREQAVRTELAQANKADKDKIANLEKQLADIQAKLNNPEDALEAYKTKLAQAYQAIDTLKREVLPEQIKQAQQTLTQGNTADAEILFKQVLARGTENAAQAAYQLGELAENRVAYASAEGYFSKAAQLQPDNTQYLNAAGRLAFIRGHYTEAEPLMKRALSIDEASYGKDHPNVARDLNNLAQLLQATNRLAEAEPLMKRALSIDEASYGKDHPDVATALNNLALLLKATNRLVEAEPLMKRALSIDEASYGKDHPDVARDLNNLAVLLQDTHRWVEAEPLSRRATLICARSLGWQHPNTKIASSTWTAILSKRGKQPDVELKKLLAETQTAPNRP